MWVLQGFTVTRGASFTSRCALIIRSLRESEPSAVRPLIRDIFFLSADPRNVSDDEDKNEAFFKKWTDYYLTREPENTLLAWIGDRMAGYLSAGDSFKALPYYESVNPSFSLFSDLFEKYPVHLHMNCHPDFRGQGVGGALIEHLVRKLKEKNTPGVHLVTSPGLRNVGFYTKNGFDFQLVREWKSKPLLFMGRALD